MPSYETTSKKAMQAEGQRLLDMVKKIEIPSDVQDLIQKECNTAFAKTDKCPPGTDIVFMPDVSGSMKPNGTRAWAWNTQEVIVTGIVAKAIEYDQGGIDIWPIRKTTDLEKMANPENERKLNVTNDQEALKYVRSFEDKLGTTPTRPLFAARVGEMVKNAIANPIETKRHLYLISTDGNPDADAKTMTQTTNEAIMALHNAGLDPRRYMAVSYIIITTDFHCMCGYLKLEDRSIWGPEEAPIECDVANAMFPVLITALGGFSSPIAIAIALAGAISPEIDTALENILKGPAKDLMDLMHAYVNKGYHDEEY